jgi:hypothetical protein
MAITRPQLRDNYSIPDLTRYLNRYLLDIYTEVDKLSKGFRLGKYDATANPAVTNDITEGYGQGSAWYNTSTGKWWFCDDASLGAASWKVIN